MVPYILVEKRVAYTTKKYIIFIRSENQIY